jgi:uncharacterized protein YbaR (Trm112 family)
MFGRKKYQTKLNKPKRLNYSTMDTKLLELLVCPVTKGPLRAGRPDPQNPALQELVSKSARLAYPVRDGIPILLEAEARVLTDEEIEQLQG